MGKALVVALLTCAMLLISACGTGRFVQRGINQYNVADLNGAMREWQNVESIEADLNPKGRVRYLVYRGLTHYERREPSAALHFLSLGKQAYDRGDTAWLPPNIKAKMDYALADMTRHLAPAPPPYSPAPPPPTPAPR